MGRENRKKKREGSIRVRKIARAVKEGKGTKEFMKEERGMTEENRKLKERRERGRWGE